MSYIKDSLYGFVIGDAMGVPVEFQSRDTLRKNPVTDMIGYGSYFYIPEGVWSDDSALTLATMDSINKCGKIDYKDMMDKFCNWERHGEYTGNGEVFDIGITTKYALRRYMDEHLDPLACGGDGIGENGNGSLMRMLPIALYCFQKKIDDAEILDIVKNTSSLTHAHEQSVLGCFIYVQFVIFLLNGSSLEDAYSRIQKLNYSMFLDETVAVYQRILQDDIFHFDLNSIHSGGYIVHTLEAVLWTIFHTHNYSDAILTSVNLGDDTDTVAAITGSIAGILYGYDSIPVSWIEKLKNKELLNNIIYEFDK